MSRAVRRRSVAGVGTSLSASGSAPLTLERALTAWSVDLPVLVLVAGALAAYVVAARRVPAWRGRDTAWFAGGLATLVVVTMSSLGTYDHTLFWVLGVQDVLVMTLVPIGLTLGRPVALWRALRPRERGRGRVARVLGFPLVGSVLAVTLLVLVYTTGWDAARLSSEPLFQATRLLLLGAGCAFLWPLLGVDAGTGSTSYPVRALVAFLDGLLDAVPGLAVLGAGHVIALAHYTGVGRTWGPTLDQGPAARRHRDDRAVGAGGLPALLVLVLAWVRRDAQEAREVDDALDVVAAAEAVVAPTAVQRPWWETDPGPLAGRAERKGWGRPEA